VKENAMNADSHDDAGSLVDDKTAEARERIDRIEKSAGGASADAQQQAQDVEDRLPERRTVEQKLGDLESASRDLKQRIDDEKRKHDMPINSSLGDPATDAANADGHNDLPDEDDV
jgi:hypothetical protein